MTNSVALKAKEAVRFCLACFVCREREDCCRAMVNRARDYQARGQMRASGQGHKNWQRNGQKEWQTGGGLKKLMRRGLKGAAALVLGVLLCLSSLPLFSDAAWAADISSAYETMKNQYPEYLQTMKDNGATEDQIKSFVNDLNKELSKTALNESNFDQTLINTSISLILSGNHNSVAKALIKGYGGYVDAINRGEVPEPLRPVRNTLYSLLVSTSSSGGGGGGGGGGAATQTGQQAQLPAAQEIAHELGTALVNTAAGAVVLAIDPGKIAAHLDSHSREVNIALPAETASRCAVVVPTEVLSKAREKNKTLVIDSGAVKLGLPASFLGASSGGASNVSASGASGTGGGNGSGSSAASPSVTVGGSGSNAAGGGSSSSAASAAAAASAVTVQIEKLDSTSRAVVLMDPKTTARGLSPRGEVYDFKVYLGEENGTLIEKFSAPVKVSIALSSSNNSAANGAANGASNGVSSGSSSTASSGGEAAGASPGAAGAASGISASGSAASAACDKEKLGIYRFDPDTAQWQYVGGRLSADGKRIETQVKSFSRYAVMEYQKHFPDLPPGHWARRDVEIMAARHIVEGMPSGKFEPDAKVTRAQFAALVQRSLGLESAGGTGGVFSASGPAIENSSGASMAGTGSGAGNAAGAAAAFASLKDVPANAWYYNAVAAAVQAGIITGYEDRTFRPDQVITRQEMAVMIMRAARWARAAGASASAGALQAAGSSAPGAPGAAASAAGAAGPAGATGAAGAVGAGGTAAAALSPAAVLSAGQAAALLEQFADSREISPWAREAVAAAVEAGLIQGRSVAAPGGSMRQFVPGGTATRAEAAVILKRLLQYASLY